MQQRSPDDYQPRLSLWGHIWRYLAALAISVVGLTSSAGVWPEWRLAVDLSIGVVALVLVFWRRRWPFAIATITAIAGAFSILAAGASALALVSLATRRRWGEIIPISLLSFVQGMFWFAVMDVTPGKGPQTLGVWGLNAGVNVVVVAALVAWGMYIGSRRELIATLRVRAETAEAEQSLRVSQARETERRRIAREMHDVLAHRISHISMQAGALSYREDLSADQVRGQVGAIRDVAHTALEDLRTVLGVLRGTGEDPETAPQPTYADVCRLVEEARTGGMNVDFEDEVEGTPPETIGRSIYRVVQEGITNARKHAPGAHLEVTLRGSEEDGITVDLRNRLGFGSNTPGSGLGLIGLSERADLAGGRLGHRTEKDVFILEAWLPWGQ
ncbi:signal transduction histidine kinase [Nocardioides luteus]|uniref:sensor histidine kinase n=1 Tax=Nocardioides luteus TaxID=1844 RepID=UPI001E3137B7|nr:histidine kinase [Nocardioides luteus]MDR7309606.1 signal transduction histidine kinase [Nocardioides luteus]